MSNRSSSELIEACRAAATQPVLERLRFYEGLQPLDVDQVDELFSAIDPDEDAGWLPCAFAQLVPPIYWLTRKRGDTIEDNWLEEMVTWRLGDRWITILLGALTTRLPPQPILARLRDRLERTPRLVELFEPAWPQITQLAANDDQNVRYTAALLALLGKRITPAVTAAIGELLAMISEEDDSESYDDQVFGESLLGDVAKAGPLLSPLAPHIERLLGSSMPAFRAAAAQVAGALGEPQLVDVLAGIERFQSDDEFEIKGVRAMMRFARWQLTGELAWLDRALEDAGDSLVYSFRIFLAFDHAPVDARLIAGLAHAARKPGWYRYACNVLAKIGRPAAAAIAALPQPPEAYSDTVFAWHHARWRAALIDDAALVAALQPLLADSHHAWKPYVETNLGTPLWRSTIEAAIGTDDARDVLAAIAAVPAVGVQFVRELAAAGREDEVESLWCTLPRDTFWAHAEA